MAAVPTGQLGTPDSVLGSTVYLAYPAAGSPSLSRSAENTLVLAQDAIGVGPLTEAEATNVLALLDQDVTVVQSGFGRQATDDLALTQEATSSIKTLVAENTLVLTQNVYLPVTYELDAESDLDILFTWQQTAEVHGTLRIDAESIIVLDQFADHQIKDRDLSNSLALTQAATYEKIYTAASTIVLTQAADEGFITLQAENTLEITQSVRALALDREADNTLELSQEVTSSIRMLFAESTLDLDQDEDVRRPWYVSAESPISTTTPAIDPETGLLIVVYTGFDDPNSSISELVDNTFNRASSQIIQVQQAATVVFVDVNAKVGDATNALALTQEAIHGFSVFAESAIELTQEATGLTAEQTSSELSLDQDVFVQAILGAPAVSDLELRQSAIAVKIDDTTLCDYAPAGGLPQENAPTPPRPVIPPPAVSNPVDRFKLVYPHFGLLETGATLQESLVLRAPRFGNREGVLTTRINRETRNGTLIVYRDPMWPEFFQLTLEFGALTVDQGRGLLDFIENTLGLEIGIQDHEARWWRGFITNPEDAVTHDGKLSYSASLQIEAKQLVTPEAGAKSYIGLAQDTTLVFVPV